MQLFFLSVPLLFVVVYFLRKCAYRTSIRNQVRLLCQSGCSVDQVLIIDCLLQKLHFIITTVFIFISVFLLVVIANFVCGVFERADLTLRRVLNAPSGHAALEIHSSDTASSKIDCVIYDNHWSCVHGADSPEVLSLDRYH